MKKSGTKVLALLLCAVMVLGMLPVFGLPVGAYAADGEPGNTVFSDNFESYAVGAAITENMPEEYTSFGANANFQIVDDGTGNKVLQGNTVLNTEPTAGYELNITSVGGEREIVYDFLLRGAIGSYGGLYVDMTGCHGYQIMPGFSRNVDITGVASPGSLYMGFAQNTWYSVKVRLVNGMTMFKIWAKDSGEPDNWSFTSELTQELPEESTLNINLLHVEAGAASAPVWFDNFSITNWEETEDPDAFSDDFEAYDIGTATTGNMPDAYTTLGANAQFQIVDDGTGNQVLQGKTAGAEHTVAISCVGSERDIAYDFYIDGTINSYGGLYVTVEPRSGSDDYYYSIMPNYSTKVMFSQGGTNIQGFNMDIAQKTWYSAKTRLADGNIYIKIWAKGSTEPSGWSLTQTLPLTVRETAGFSVGLIQADSAAPATVWLDNISIKPYAAPVLPGPFDVEVSTQDIMRGTVSGSGTFAGGESVTVTATPNTGYTFKEWRANGSVVSTDAAYTFEATRDIALEAIFYAAADTPTYAYFEDDYESYDIGTVSRDTMPLQYTDFSIAGQFRIVDDGTGNQVLQGNSGSQGEPGDFSLDLNIIDKEILYDFYIGGHFSSYGGLYVTFHGQPEGGYYYSITPSFSPQLIISQGTQNIGRCYDASFAENTWYTMKTRVVDEKIWIKVWERGTDEPADWTFIYSTAGFDLDGTYASFGMDFIQIDSNEVVPVWIDNLSVYTWAPLPEKDECNVTVQCADDTMGTVSGGGIYLERTEVSVTAKPADGYSFVNWTDENGNEISDKAIYKFIVNEDMTLIANFEKTPVVVRSFMAAGLTEVAEIDEENQTVTARFASDVDMSAVIPYFYLDTGAYTEEQPYEEMDLSSGTATIGAGEDLWTITATQNSVMQEFYVNGKRGDDSNSGTSASDAFKTLEAAQAAVRAIDTWTGDVVIHIAKGEYVLSDTLEFTTEDSAAKGYAVIWDGGDANDVQITSGVPLDGSWTESSDVTGLDSDLVAWEYDATGIAYSRDMYVDGEMADLSTYMLDESAIGSWNQTEIPFMEVNSDGYKVTGELADMASWRNPSDIEFGYEIAWTYTIVPVESIDDLSDGAQVNMKPDAFWGARNKNSAYVRDPNYIMNCFEGLDTAGEWYFDRSAQKIYYITDGADPNGMEIVLPTLDQLITVNGKSRDKGANGAEWVYGMVFKNIGFRYTSYMRPHTYGQVEIQASFILNLDTMGSNPSALVYNFLKTDGAILASYTEGMRIQNCWFTDLAASAADFEEGCRGSQFVQNTIQDVCANGVTVGGVSGLDAQPYSDMNYIDGVLTSVTPDPDRVTEKTLILSNDIARVGMRYSGSIGIFAGYTADTTIAHNTIYDASYSGISCSWGWGEFDQGGRHGRDTYKYETPSVMARYVIEHNDISYVCQRLADGGGIYTLSFMPGSKLNGNYIHDNPIIFGGLYFDECSGGFTSIADNILYNCHTIYNYHLVHALYQERANDMRSAFDTGNNYVNVKPEDAADDARYQGIMENSGYMSELVPPTIDPAEDQSAAEEAAEEVEELINALPDPELTETDDEEAVAALEEVLARYEALSEEEKALVSEEVVEAMNALAAKLSDYDIVSGDGSLISTDNYRDLTFVANGAFSKFEGVEVDGAVVDPSNYTAEAGSTHVTFTAAYLGTLSVGKHTVTLLYTDGEVDGEFEIKAASTGGEDNEDDDGSEDGGNTGDNTGSGNTGSGDNTGSGGSSNTGSNTGSGSGTTGSGSDSGPKTGDNSNLTLWLGLMLLALAVAVLLVGLGLRRKPAKH